MRRASYRAGVAWIALNDNSGSEDGPEDIRGYVSTLLLADLFDVDETRVASDIYRARQRVESGK